MDINLFVKTYILGNEDARAFRDEGLFELAEKHGYKLGTDEFDWFVGGGAAFRFNGDTFETKNETKGYDSMLSLYYSLINTHTTQGKD